MTARIVAGRYEIVRELAAGGMGEVFEAVHTVSRRRVALKVLFPGVVKDEASRQRRRRGRRGRREGGVDRHDALARVSRAPARFAGWTWNGARFSHNRAACQ